MKLPDDWFHYRSSKACPPANQWPIHQGTRDLESNQNKNCYQTSNWYQNYWNTCSDDIYLGDQTGSLVVSTSYHLKADVCPADHPLFVVVVEGSSILQVFDDNGDIVVAVTRRSCVHKTNIFAVGKQEPRMSKGTLLDGHKENRQELHQHSHSVNLNLTHMIRAYIWYASTQLRGTFLTNFIIRYELHTTCDILWKHNEGKGELYYFLNTWDVTGFTKLQAPFYFFLYFTIRQGVADLCRASLLSLVLDPSSPGAIFYLFFMHVNNPLVNLSSFRTLSSFFLTILYFMTVYIPITLFIPPFRIISFYLINPLKTFSTKIYQFF